MGILRASVQHQGEISYYNKIAVSDEKPLAYLQDFPSKSPQEVKLSKNQSVSVPERVVCTPVLNFGFIGTFRCSPRN